MTREYNVLEIEDGKVISIHKQVVTGELTRLDQLHSDIIMNGDSMKEVIMAVLRKHENVSLLDDKGIEEVADDLLKEFSIKLGFKGRD